MDNELLSKLEEILEATDALNNRFDEVMEEIAIIEEKLNNLSTPGGDYSVVNDL